MGDNEVGPVSELFRDLGGQDAGRGRGQDSVGPCQLVNFLEHLSHQTQNLHSRSHQPSTTIVIIIIIPKSVHKKNICFLLHTLRNK